MVWNFQILVFWGAAIVVFLARIINFHNDDLQGFWVEVSSQVENGTCHTDTCHTCLSGLESTDFFVYLRPNYGHGHWPGTLSRNRYLQ